VIAIEGLQTAGYYMEYCFANITMLEVASFLFLQQPGVKASCSLNFNQYSHIVGSKENK